MPRLGSIPGMGPAAAGLTLAADGLAARLLLRADEASVWFLGRPLPWVCEFHSRTGLPCPTCGMTRSLVLSLHGEFDRAWRLSPAGPLVILGLAALAAVLLGLAGARRLRWAKPERAGGRGWLPYAVLTYASAVTVVWLSGWLASLAAAWPGR